MTVRRRAPGDPVRIATRGSELALRQARMVQLELSVRMTCWPEIVAMPSHRPSRVRWLRVTSA